MTGGEISENTMLPGGANIGGGVFNSLIGSMRLLGVKVQGNSAVSGGGIYTSGKIVLGNNVNISGNKASSNGAGMYVAGGTATMLGGGITNNTAQLNGGGLYVVSGQLTLQNGVLVSTNEAVGSDGGGHGGGAYISGGRVIISGGSMSFNKAGYSGGGLYVWGGGLTLESSVNIKDNWANNQGGGIYLAGPFSTTTFNGVLVSANWTNGNQQTTGWGVYWQNGANVTILAGGLTDQDDPNGKPVQGS